MIDMIRMEQRQKKTGRQTDRQTDGRTATRSDYDKLSTNHAHITPISDAS